MDRALALLLALGLLQPGRDEARPRREAGAGRGFPATQPLRVEPPGPVVAVAMGASRQLTCRMSCADGAAWAQWRGLDTNLGAVQSGTGHSVLSVSGATLADAGTRVCVGSCGGRNFQRSVQILVYAFPDQLEVSPAALVPGPDQEVSCTAHNVTPASEDTLSFSLLLGGQELEGVQALGREQEEEPQEAGDLLFHVTEHWLLPTLGIPAPSILHCQVTMVLPGLELSHQRVLPVLHSQTSPDPPDPTSPGPPKITSQEPPNLTSLNPQHTNSMETPSTTSPRTTFQQNSALSPRIPGSERTCHPQIHQPPMLAEREAPWELLCEAPCGPGVAVHWTLAPGGLDAYDRREAGSKAWLRVPTAGPIPEGWFQCRLHPDGLVASLYVPGQEMFQKTLSSPEGIQPPAALWMGSLVLGLLLLVFLTYRLWKRCWPPAEDHTPAPPGQVGTPLPAPSCKALDSGGTDQVPHPWRLTYLQAPPQLARLPPPSHSRTGE